MKTILLTRLAEDNQLDCLAFQAKGFEVLAIPLISLKARSNPTMLTNLKKSEWIFLTSHHSASFFLEQVRKNSDLSILMSKKFAVIGTKTAQVVRDNHLEVAFIASHATKRDLMYEWSTLNEQPTTILLPKSNLADDSEYLFLKQLGHTTYTEILYDNVFPKDNRGKLRHQLKSTVPDAVYLASPSLWYRFLEVYVELDLSEMPTLYCLGPTTQKAIEASGYRAILLNNNTVQRR